MLFNRFSPLNILEATSTQRVQNESLKENVKKSVAVILRWMHRQTNAMSITPAMLTLTRI